MPFGEFSSRLKDFGEWIVIHAESCWYVGSGIEFLEVFLPAARAISPIEKGLSVGELLQKIGVRDALYVGRGATSRLKILATDRVGERYNRAISRDLFGKLILWEHSASDAPDLIERRVRAPLPRGAPLDPGPSPSPPSNDHWPAADDDFPAFDLQHDYETAASGDPGRTGNFDIEEVGAPPEENSSSPGVLAAETAALTFPELDLTNEPEGGRWINAVLEDHDAAEPLIFLSNYVLAISIDLDESTSVGAVGGALASNLTRDTKTEIKLAVTLNSSDFDISGSERPLRINKAGLSIGKARFDIQPKIENGSGRLTAIIHRDNNFVQQLDIVLEVGGKTREGPVVTSVGRPVEAAKTLSRRDIGILIKPSPAGGYECITWGATASFAHLPVSNNELAQGIENARRALLSVVMTKDANGHSPFQEAVVIDPTVSTRGLKAMARAGYLLFRSLFFHPAADAQCQSLGTYLIDEVAKAEEGFTLQVLARDFPVPWSLLYITDAWDEASVRWDGFLGAKLVVEQIPLCNDSNRRDTRISGIPDGLAVSLNFNSDIDAQFRGGFVATQQAYWQAVTHASPRIRSVTRTSKVDLINSLKDVALSDQIIYFYCHAESLGLGAGGGPGQSRLIMSGSEQVTLDDLNLDAPAQKKLRGAPLVFINACESGELSPLFYNGFVPYFLSKGARGVIGTECKVPALFATEWARRFFDEFLGGAPIGETVLKLRNEFFVNSGNPLGLLYGVHCNADTQIQPLP